MSTYRLLYIAESFLLLIFIFLVNHDIPIGSLLKMLGIDLYADKWPDIKNLWSYLIYLVFIWFATWLMTRSFRKIKNQIDVLETQIEKIYPASENFLPTFFTYIFLGLSINSLTALIVSFAAITVFCYCGELYMYNPLFYMLGFRFYYVETVSKSKFLLITREKILKGHTSAFPKLKQLNDYTYIDLKSQI